VNGQRVRAEINQIVVWFADPKHHDVCLDPDQGPVTPFDGDGVAGAVAFDSAGSTPLPARWPYPAPKRARVSHPTPGLFVRLDLRAPPSDSVLSWSAELQHGFLGSIARRQPVRPRRSASA
jgi:hypothetical protein